MADKKLSEVTKVTDMAYVPVILSDGSVGQIAKADLASVVAGIIGTATTTKSGLRHYSDVSGVTEQSTPEYPYVKVASIKKQGVGFALILSVLKNHQINRTVAILTGYYSNATTCDLGGKLLMNSFTTNVYYIATDTSFDIYVHSDLYTYSQVKLIGTTHSNLNADFTCTLVSALPSDAVEVTLT